MWILIDCALPEKYVDAWGAFAKGKGATEEGVVKDEQVVQKEYEKKTTRLNEILREWVTTTFDKGQDMRVLMDVVQRKDEDVLDYWGRFKDAIQKHTDWIADDTVDMKRPEVVNVLVGGLLPEIREEIELRTTGWRKMEASALIEIAQVAYDVLQKRKDKLEKKEKTKIMNMQTPEVKEKIPESKGVPVSTVQVTPQGVPVAAPPYPPSGVVYISNYGMPQNKRSTWKQNGDQRRAPRVQPRYQQIIPNQSGFPTHQPGFPPNQLMQPRAPPTCFKCGAFFCIVSTFPL